MFEYKITIIHEPEDNDSTVVKACGKVSKEYLDNMLEGCWGFKKLFDENNGFIHQYPSLYDGEKLTTAMLLDDFAKQYSAALRWGVNIH